MDKKAELPDLKKKERERKKAGLFWGDGAGARAAWEGAAGGLGEGAGAALEGAEGLAAEGSVAAMDAAESAAGRGLLARLAAFIGRLAGTFAGKLVLLGLAALSVAAALYAAARFLEARAAAAAAGSNLSLTAPDDRTRIYTPRRSRSLDYMNQAYKGELKGDEDDAAAGKNGKGAGDGKDAKAGDGAGESDKDKGAADWKQALLDGSWRKDRLAHNMSDAHLSDSLGGGFSKNVFAAAGAPKFGDGFDRGRLAQAVPPAAGGRAAGIRKGATPQGKSGSSSPIRAKRAIGQLRAANALSTKATQVGNEETAKTMATDAFNGAVGSGNAAPPASPISMDGPNNIAGTPGGTVNPTIPSGGGGTPGLPGTPNPPDANPVPQQDYQPKVDTASNLIDQAAQMKKRSMMLMLIGLGLIAAGAALLGNPFTTAIGIAMIAAGAMLVGMAIMLAMMASKMAAQAQQIGQELQAVYGQQAQNQVIDTCAQQAASSGQKCAQSATDAMAPASLPKNNQMGDAGKAAAEENYGKDSQYSIDGQGGGPVGGGH